MSAFAEAMAALGRILERRGPLGWPEPVELETALASEPGPALLPWPRARFVPVSIVGQVNGRRSVAGTLYGREFTVWFPSPQAQPAGHVWGLACWSPEDSGTHRPEVLAICRTCTDARGSEVVVGPASCVLRNGGRS